MITSAASTMTRIEERLLHLLASRASVSIGLATDDAHIKRADVSFYDDTLHVHLHLDNDEQAEENKMWAMSEEGPCPIILDAKMSRPYVSQQFGSIETEVFSTSAAPRVNGKRKSYRIAQYDIERGCIDIEVYPV